MPNKMIVIHSLLLVSSMIANASFADITVNVKGKNGRDSVIQVKGNLGKMTSTGEKGYLVYNTATGVAVHADPERGTYMEMDEAQINKQMDQAAAMRKQMAPQIKMMKEQMANMDPATRKMLEERMGGMKGLLDGVDSKPEKQSMPKLTKTGSKKVAGLKCEAYKVTSAGKHVADVCLMKSASGKISKQDFATLEATMKFFRDMAKKASGIMGGSSRQVLALITEKGVPVAVEDKQGGDSHTVESVSDEELSGALFTEYKKLKKTEMPSLMQ